MRTLDVKEGKIKPAVKDELFRENTVEVLEQPSKASVFKRIKNRLESAFVVAALATTLVAAGCEKGTSVAGGTDSLTRPDTEQSDSDQTNENGPADEGAGSVDEDSDAIAADLDVEVEEGDVPVFDNDAILVDENADAVVDLDVEVEEGDVQVWDEDVEESDDEASIDDTDLSNPDSDVGVVTSKDCWVDSGTRVVGFEKATTDKDGFTSLFRILVSDVKCPNGVNPGDVSSCLPPYFISGFEWFCDTAGSCLTWPDEGQAYIPIPSFPFYWINDAYSDKENPMSGSHILEDLFGVRQLPISEDYIATNWLLNNGYAIRFGYDEFGNRQMKMVKCDFKGMLQDYGTLHLRFENPSLYRALALYVEPGSVPPFGPLNPERFEVRIYSYKYPYNPFLIDVHTHTQSYTNSDDNYFELSGYDSVFKENVKYSVFSAGYNERERGYEICVTAGNKAESLATVYDNAVWEDVYAVCWGKGKKATITYTSTRDGNKVTRLSILFDYAKTF